MQKINKRSNRSSNHNKKNNDRFHHDNTSIIDNIDKKIIELLLSNHDNSAIAKKLKIPLSTIQRRTRKLFEKELVSTKVELNYQKLGYKRGLLHVYLQKGLMEQIGKSIVKKRGILSVSVHVGNSDLVALFVYRDTKDLIETMGEIKEIEGVDRVLWSEEVYFIAPPSEKNLFI
ncbi:MAG TPA: Lrp/AsnC family transcriptional regulator [Nitrososphaeraceae archaeon]|nr:Lrp/AsnC family transcriptional regulator [Nitrososphaeraceae archaeon]